MVKPLILLVPQTGIEPVRSYNREILSLIFTINQSVTYLFRPCFIRICRCLSRHVVFCFGALLHQIASKKY